MADPSSDEKMVAPPPPGYERMKQHDELLEDLQANAAELQKVKRDVQDQRVGRLTALQEAIKYKHLYEQSLQQEIA
ncbi:hypothetical protein PVAP13_7NG135987 [Panicum virgatum]|uniref:Uncharacterized protein n=1 Tax=Panicum virgatum TaxID=38727 RepID=A0A8T0PSZ3_PANVG|nr:hypothetical protein PVAP13_7NG135987 [Panicum virgatum]